MGSRHFQLEMHEREHAQAFAEQAFGDVRLDLLPSTMSFEWRVRAVEVGPLFVVPGCLSGAVHLHGTISGTILSLIHEGLAQVGDHCNQVRVGSGRAGAVYSSGMPGSWQSEGRVPTAGIRFAPGFLARQLELLTGSTVEHEPRFAVELPTARGAGATLERIGHLLLAEAERGFALLEHPVVATSLSDMLARARLLGHPHDHMALLERPTPRVDARIVRQVEDYVRAHAGEPITIGDLALLTSCAGQAIEAAFLAERGSGVAAFIRRARLEHARAALLHDPSLTPSRAAYAAGFTQPERFAADYFVAFGEQPEQTWRHTQARLGPNMRASARVGARGSAATVFVICDDPHRVARMHAWLRAAGHDVELFDSVSAFSRGHAAARAGCVIVDLALPDHGRLAEQAPTLPRIGLASGDLRTAVAAMKAGALDVLDELDPGLLLGAVEAGLARDHAQRERAAERMQREARLATLTTREREVVERVARGLLNKQIAAELGISEATVRVHRARGMDKLGADSVIELVHALLDA